MTKENLKKEILESKKKLLSLRIKKSSGELKDTSVVSKLKKEIARLFTKMNTQD